MIPGPLDGLRVLDLSRVLAGPWCTQLLGDYGADVVKVEEPHTGDPTRGWGPPWAGGESAYFLSANRNKRSICIDLKHAAGREVTARLARCADVVIENFRPGGAARLGLDYATLSRDNPRLVYCSITGYGQDGPERDRPGYDFVHQAEGGLMSITGPTEGPPSKVGVAIVDVCAGLYAASAILAALHERERSGQGQYVDIALFDTQLSILANVAQNCLVTGEAPARYGNGHPSIVPYQPFRTADGEIAVAIGGDAQYARFCDAIGRPDLCRGELAQNAGRVLHRETLCDDLQAIFSTRTSADWLALLHGIGAPAGPIRDVAAALNDAQVAARGMVQRAPHPAAGDIRMVGPVAHFGRTPASVRAAPPLLGQHSDEVLEGWLGISADEIAALREVNAVR